MRDGGEEVPEVEQQENRGAGRVVNLSPIARPVGSGS
jgi:hypothetical protein